jgi:hypothetical protein
MPNLSLWPLLEQLTIKTKENRLIKLDRNDPFAWAQREFVREIEWQYNNGLPIRIIVLKGRQIGCSTITEAVLFLWSFLYPGAGAVVLSKEKDDSEYLMGMTKRYWEMSDFSELYGTNYNSKNYMEWENGSWIFTDTAKKADPGRGKTVSAAHCSECAFWPEEDKIVGSLMEAIPDTHGTICVLESTANGVGGYFHDEWVKAVAGASPFTPMFFPWWMHDEYQIRDSHLRYQDLDDEERQFLDEYGPGGPKNQYPEGGLTISKLAWRRRKMSTYNDMNEYRANYPMDPEDAFLSTGVNVFDLERLKLCYEPMDGRQGSLQIIDGRFQWLDHPNGHTWMYVEPDQRKRRRYVVAVDPTYTLEGDPACIQVMDRASMEQVAVWHGHADPETIGEIAWALAMFYGPEAILNTEVEGGGQRVLEVWRDKDYPHIWMDRRPDRPKKLTQSYCWNTTFKSKNYLVGTMQGCVKRRGVLIHHRATFYEMTRWVIKDDGTFGPARRSGHDDTVMSLGIGIVTVQTEAGTMPWGALAAPGPYRGPGEKVIVPGIGEPVEIPGVNRSTNDALWGSEAMVGVDEVY